MSSVHYPDVSAFVLAGGHSRRMGFDKRAIVLDGLTLLELIGRRIAEATGQSPWFVGDSLSDTAPAGSRTIGDAAPDCGPLGGLVAALEACPTSWALILAADLPRITERELRLLLDVPREGLDVAAFAPSGVPEPLAALYNRRTAPFWRHRLLEGKLSLRDGITLLQCLPVDPGGAGRALLNLNTPADLDLLRRSNH
jgi:molybdopterin-guanine dinucleotide biosynthesis protein A